MVPIACPGSRSRPRRASRPGAGTNHVALRERGDQQLPGFQRSDRRNAGSAEPGIGGLPPRALVVPGVGAVAAGAAPRRRSTDGR